MTEHSYNGWLASRDPKTIHVVPLVVAGVPFVPGVRSGDVHTVLEYVLTQFHDRVEPLKSPGCWGWSYRANRNDPSELSCHASATAADANAPKHNNGHEATSPGGGFTQQQVDEIHRILSEIPELDEVVHWGGDWHRAHGLTPDPMHFEIHDHDTAKLARVVQRINNQEDDMPLTKKDTAAIWHEKIGEKVLGDGGIHVDAAFSTVYVTVQDLEQKIDRLTDLVKTLIAKKG